MGQQRARLLQLRFPILGSQLFRVLFVLRCLCLPMTLLPSSCIVQTKVLGRRGFAVELPRGWRKCCHQLGPIWILPIAVNNAHQLEVAVDGLHCTVAVDTTLVSALHCDGTARRGAADRDGVALDEAKRYEERTYPELVQPGHWAKMVVLACEVGIKWSLEAMSFISHQTKARAQAEPTALIRRVEQSWRLR